MLDTEVILQIDKSEELLPLSVPSVCAPVYHRLVCLSRPNLFVT